MSFGGWRVVVGGVGIGGGDGGGGGYSSGGGGGGNKPHKLTC